MALRATSCRSRWQANFGKLDKSLSVRALARTVELGAGYARLKLSRLRITEH